MSGLAAQFYRDGRLGDRQAVWAMLAAAPYRGPDGQFVRSFGPIALGHLKLAVTPEEELEQQPVVSPRTGSALIADARLDNRADLLSRLPERTPASASDAELILRAYEAWGLDALPRLLGDFAFVLWDARRQCMICARDTSGQRGLFYRVDRQTFAAASEIQQLLQDPAVPVAPNEERIRDYLTPFHMNQNEAESATTFYEGILAVPAGHFLWVDRETVRLQRYWDFDPPTEIRYRRESDYDEHYREMFFEVVRARLRSARPIGILLSGGLDSSSIAGAAQQLYRAGQATDAGFTSFTAVYEDLACDERDFVQEIQAMYGFEARFVPCGDLGGHLDLDPRGFEEAPNLGVSESRDLLYGAVHRSGVRALLTGSIADACVGGSWLVFDSLLRHFRPRAFWRYLRAYRRRSDERLMRTVALACVLPLLPIEWQRRVATVQTQHELRRVGQRLTPSWMPEPFRDELRRRNWALTLASARDRRFASPAREAEYHFLYPPEVARPPVPWPLEIWSPYADRRLHEFLLAIPPELKFEPHPASDDSYAGSKRLVRRAMQGIIPERIRARTSRTAFAQTIVHELDRQWTLYQSAFGPSTNPEIVARAYVDRERFWLRLRALRDGDVGRDLHYIVAVVELERWLRALQLPRPQQVTVPPPWCEPALTTAPASGRDNAGSADSRRERR